MEGRAMTTLRAAILALVIGLGLGTAFVFSAWVAVAGPNDVQKP
jgi:hypothetical protein